MRAQLLTHSYLPENSPPQRRWTQLIRTFRELGWDVEVIAPVAHSSGRRTLPRKDAGRAFRTDKGRHGETIRRAPYLYHRTTRLGRFADQCFSATCSVLAALLGPKPDVVIATVPSLPILGAGFAVAKLRGVPFVADMRDAWPDIARDARLVQGGAKSIAERAIVAIQQRAENVQVMVGDDAEEPVDLVQHGTVLAGHGHKTIQAGRPAQFRDKGSHLDGFGPCPVDGHNKRQGGTPHGCDGERSGRESNGTALPGVTGVSTRF